MSVLKGFAGIKKAREKAAEAREALNNKIEWFSLSKDRKSARIVFLQELDSDGKNYNSSNGEVIALVEHQAPGKEGWKARALCTKEDEDRCYACEQYSLDPQAGWKAKTMLYINVLDLEDNKVKVLSRNVNNNFVTLLSEEYDDEGTITDRVFRITKSGEGLQTVWNLKGLNREHEPVPDEAPELYDLEKAVTAVVKRVPYSEQREYYSKALAPKFEDEPEVVKEDQGTIPW